MLNELKRHIRLVAVPLVLWASAPDRTMGQATPHEEEEWLVKGRLLISQERLPEAIEQFSLRKQEAPLDARAYFYSGMAFAQMSNLSAAAADLKEAVRLDPGSLQYAILYADVSVRLKHDELALEILAPFADRSKLEDLNSAWVWLLCETYIRAGDNDSGDQGGPTFGQG